MTPFKKMPLAITVMGSSAVSETNKVAALTYDQSSHHVSNAKSVNDNLYHSHADGIIYNEHTLGLRAGRQSDDSHAHMACDLVSRSHPGNKQRQENLQLSRGPGSTDRPSTGTDQAVCGGPYMSPLRVGLMLGAPLLAILAATLVLPLTGEHVLAVVITLLAALIITL